MRCRPYTRMCRRRSPTPRPSPRCATSRSTSRSSICPNTLFQMSSLRTTIWVQLCRDGLSRRVEDAGEEEEQRLEYELEVIRQTRYSNYFLVVWDIARFAREKDIYFAVRGSAAGSLVLFALGVTDVNPLQYRIVFERFLNVERKEMPDIDMDFQDDRREEIIDYVVSRYGRDHVAQIITFGDSRSASVYQGLGPSAGDALRRRRQHRPGSCLPGCI